MNINSGQKSFTTFLRGQGISAERWLVLTFGFLLVIGVSVLDIYHKRFPISGLFLSLSIVGGYLLVSWFSYAMYRKGRQLMRLPACGPFVFLENVKVNIQDFYLLDAQKTFPPSLSRTIYDFEEADLILRENSVIVLGKRGAGYPAPVELILAGIPVVYDNHAALLAIQGLSDRRVELTINDPIYNSHIKMVLEFDETLGHWLAKQQVT